MIHFLKILQHRVSLTLQLSKIHFIKATPRRSTSGPFDIDFGAALTQDHLRPLLLILAQQVHADHAPYEKAQAVTP